MTEQNIQWDPVPMLDALPKDARSVVERISQLNNDVSNMVEARVSRRLAVGIAPGTCLAVVDIEKGVLVTSFVYTSEEQINCGFEQLKNNLIELHIEDNGFTPHGEIRSNSEVPF